MHADQYNWRFQKIASDGTIFLDIAASADLTAEDDLPCSTIYLNGYPINGALLEAVMDQMEETGVFETMREMLRQGDSAKVTCAHKVENTATRFAQG